MHDRSIIIIGGGIAGLSAGVYGQLNGFRTRIFEMHKKKPGGLCTAWKRQGYTVNGCLHWLVGSGPASKFHGIWNDLGALDGSTIVDYDEFGRVEFANGERLVFPADIDEMERTLKAFSPDDAPVIDEFIGAVRACTRVEPPIEKAPEVMGFLDVLKLIVTSFPLFPILWKWNRVSLRDFGRRFKSPELREAFPLLFMPDFPMTFMLMTFAWLHRRTAGYPLGGSLEFSRSIEKRYLALGGEMVYKSRVAKILTENDRAVGIRLDDGSEHFADYILSAADGHATIFELLEGRYVDDRIRGYYEKLLPFPPLVFISLGVKRTFDQPASIGTAYELAEPVRVGKEEHRFLNAMFYTFDPTLAPEGKTLVTVMFTTDFEYWEGLRKDDSAYKAEKERIADRVVAELDKRIPGFAADVEMRDISSPTTFVRYTGNWKGSFEGWQVTPATWNLGKVMQRTLPGLANFYMAGHWVEPGGGLPAAAMSGRNVIQILCKKEGKVFRTSAS